MATKRITTLTDDLDGTPDARTVAFAFEGQDYEVDLSPANEAALRDLMASWVAHAHRVTAALPQRPLRHRDRHHSARVRAWAAQQGIALKERGRIPAEVVAAYDAGHGTH